MIENFKFRQGDNKRLYLDTEIKKVKKLILEYFKELKGTIRIYKKRIFEERRLPQEAADYWHKLTKFYVEEKLSPLLLLSISKAGENLERHIKREKQFTFITTTSYIVDWVNNNSGDLINLLNSRQLETIRQVISEHIISSATSPRELAKRLELFIGLLPREAMIIVRMAEALSSVMSWSLALRQIENYAAHLLSIRAERIARTELTKAFEYGTWQAILQAMEAGYVDGDVKKTWITAIDERVCQVCGEIDGETRDFEEDFSVGIPYPPLHPSCRCDVTYEIIRR